MLEKAQKQHYNLGDAVFCKKEKLMKNIIKFILCFCAAAVFTTCADAGVNFIVQKQKSNNIPKTHTCLKKGFSKRNCPTGQYPADLCPEDSSYFRVCCDASYNYTYEQCLNNNMIPSGKCGDKYRCSAR